MPTVFQMRASDPLTPREILANAVTRKTSATMAPWMGNTSGIPSHMLAPIHERCQAFTAARSRKARARRTVSR